MRVISVVGARSELVKCSPVVQRIREAGHEHVLVHTGAAFDYGTSPAFFADLGLAPPENNLGFSPVPNAKDLGEMLQGLGPLVRAHGPDWVMVYGTSAATMAGVLVAIKQGRSVGQVGAGLRSYRRNTLDELNHIVIDHVSTLHFCPTQHEVDALAREGLKDGVHRVGDLLLDHVLRNFERAETEIGDRALDDAVGLNTRDPFAFATIHHLENTQDELRLGALIEAFSRIEMPVVLPLHPVTQQSLTERPSLVSRIGPNVNIVDPLRPLESLRVVSRSNVVLTDSGGLQREAFFLGVPCITLRDDTEWVDTLSLSANTVVGADIDTIARAVRAASALPRRGLIGRDGSFGDGRAGERIVDLLETSRSA